VEGGFVIALVCVVLVGVASYLSLDRLTRNAGWVAHTDRVIGGLQLLLTTVTDGETAERGYVITGDESYLEPFQHAVKVLGSEFQQLKQVTADNASQQQRLDRLEPLLKERMEAFVSIIDLRKTQGFEAAERGILTGRGKAMQDAIRRAIDEMKSTEQTLLAQREARTRRSTGITQAAVLGGSGIAFAVVGLSLVAIRRDFAGRHRAEQALRAVNEQLEARVRERTTELSRANDSLQRNEKRFRAYVSATSDVIYRMSADWREMYQLQGQDFIADTQEPSSTWLTEYIHPDDQTLVMATVGEAIRTKSTYTLEHRVLRVDGTLGWTFSRAIPLLDERGEIVEWFGAASDVSKRKEAELKLQAQLVRLNLLGGITRAISERQDVHSIFQVVVRTLEEEFHADFCCICLYDPHENSLTVTSVGVRSEPIAKELRMPERARVDIDANGLSRCVRGQLVYEPDVRAVAFPFPERLARGGLRSLVAAPLLGESKVFGALVAARKEAGGFSSGECEFLRQLSEHVGLAAQQAQLYETLQRAYDDLKQTQQAVMQQERLLALGKMASGIAHDINNAISPIMIYTESLLEREPGLSPTMRSNLEVVHRAINDVAQTVSRMREFYRAREPQQALLPVDLNALVLQVLDLTRARWSDMTQRRGVAINVRTDLAPDLPVIAGIGSELRDALTNLIFNAVDAMPGGGELHLRTSLIGSARETGRAAGRAQVQLEVTDTGVGMDEETRRRCLEPFFTTKGERGTGLGLATVYGTMQRHGADLDIQSAVGRGTTFRLSFVVPSIPVRTAAPSDAAPIVSPLRVLLVDDDPLILKSLGDTLEADGHLVTPVDGGQAGIDAFLSAAKSDHAFEVVITDLGMPNIDGRKVAAAVKAARADALVVMLTGWGRRMVDDGDRPPHVDRILSKPPKLRELREALAQSPVPGTQRQGV